MLLMPTFYLYMLNMNPPGIALLDAIVTSGPPILHDTRDDLIHIYHLIISQTSQLITGHFHHQVTQLHVLCYHQVTQLHVLCYHHAKPTKRYNFAQL